MPREMHAASITLSWDAREPRSPDVAGYKIYYGKESKKYTLPTIDVGNTTNYRIDNLDENNIYFFSVTAYGSDGEESDFSSEVSTFNELIGTAQLFSRKPEWASCETEDEPFSSVGAYLSFDYLLNQFIYQTEDSNLTCDDGFIIQDDNNTIETTCFKRGPLFGIAKIYTFKFEASGNISLKNFDTMTGNVFILFNKECPYYVIEIEDIMPMQQ